MMEEEEDENPKLPSSISSFFPLLSLKPLPKNPLLFCPPPFILFPSINTSSELRGLSLLVLSKDSLKNLKEENLGRAAVYGPSRTVVGEGILVILFLLGSVRSILQGGGSKVLAGPGRGMMSVQGRGLPGCSSHLNGTEARVWSGGVEIPDGWSGECTAAAGKGRSGNSKPPGRL